MRGTGPELIFFVLGKDILEQQPPEIKPSGDGVRPAPDSNNFERLPAQSPQQGEEQAFRLRPGYGLIGTQ